MPRPICPWCGKMASAKDGPWSCQHCGTTIPHFPSYTTKNARLNLPLADSDDEESANGHRFVGPRDSR